MHWLKGTACVLILCSALVSVLCNDSGWTNDRALRVQEQALKALNSGDLKGARVLFEELVAVFPHESSSRFNLGWVYWSLREIPLAIDAYAACVQIVPDFFDARINLGTLLLETNQNEKALAQFEEAAKLKPESNQVLANRGAALHKLHRHKDALEDLVLANASDPSSLPILRYLVSTLSELHRFDAAQKACEQFIARNPEEVGARLLLGSVHKHLDNNQACITESEKVLAISPNDLTAHFQLGVCYSMMKKGRDRAIEHYRTVLDANPNYVEALNNIANVYKDEDRIIEAAEAYRKALRLRPSAHQIFYNLVHSLESVADWRESPWKRAREINEADLAAGVTPALNPLHAMYYPLSAKEALDIAAVHSARARSFADSVHPTPFPSTPVVTSDRRLRVGYVSTYIGAFTITYLMKSVYGMHDRSQIESFVYSLNPPDRSDWRKVVETGVEHLVDVSKGTALSVADRINRDGVHILIDLNGHIKNSKIVIFAFDPSPIQMAYMGFCGSAGATYIHYITGDALATPPEYQSDFTEKLLLMPMTYYVGDHKQHSANVLDMELDRQERAEIGLPVDKFVFFSGNQPYKFDEDVWRVWMDVLKRVPESVLWLLEFHADAVGNLQREARKYGVEASRLIFTKVINTSKHVERTRFADLFLDSVEVNAHTTAMDALWAGVPMITMMGEKMVSRVGASVVDAHGCPELIVSTYEQYADLAVELAHHPTALAALRAKVLSQRRAEGLFDTAGWVRRLERVYRAQWEVYAAGLSHRPIRTLM